jgi:hypothetical protein
MSREAEMSDQNPDLELNAIQSILSALEPLDEEARQRVIFYVLQRMKLPVSIGNQSIATTDVSQTPNTPSVTQAPVSIITDIRTLKTQKNPRTASEMTALVAYYLAELAPDEERKTSIDKSDLEKYFKQGSFVLPKAIAQTLVNAAKAGYLDSIGDGKYKLNPVGYNLVVHGLPSKQKE